ncbi:MAG: YybS family protein [Desulfobacterales bacterium]|nr:MAG: YybS family protein [Desulfobacterales bacterium]
MSVFIPIVGFVGALFIPLPILYYRLKLGRVTGGLIPIISGLMLAIVIGDMSTDILFFGGLLLLGFMLGELIELNLSIEKTLLFACGGVLLCGLIGLVIFGLISGDGIYTVVSDYVAKNLELTLVLYQSMGMSEENIQMISRSLNQIQHVLMTILPALVTMSTLFVAWTNILLAKPILKKRLLFYPDFGPLKMWKAPEVLVWGVIGCGLALFIPVTAVKVIGLNGLLILMIVYFFQGIAIVSFYFEKKRFPRVIRFFLYALIALQQLILLAVIGLGFFDMWVNFRRSGKPLN